MWYSIKAVCELRLEGSRKDSEYRKSLKNFEKKFLTKLDEYGILSELLLSGELQENSNGRASYESFGKRI